MYSNLVFNVITKRLEFVDGEPVGHRPVERALKEKAAKSDVRRIPRMFYDDHVERELDAPPIIKQNKVYVWIDTTHPHFAELLADAYHYASGDSGWTEGAYRYCEAAQRMIIALGDAGMRRAA